jgi:hypothetical protein
VPVLDEKWIRRYGGTPVVALEHGSYRSSRGERVTSGQRPDERSFRPVTKAACDSCAHGWIEDLRWRAEPTLIALAEGRELKPGRHTDPASLVRWSQLTALLAELIPGMPTAATVAQRQSVRVGNVATPPLRTWFFSPRQRLPARVVLSQIELPASGGLLQVVSVDVARFSTLVVIPSDAAADAVALNSALPAEFGSPRDPQDDGPLVAHPLDLARTPHPQRVAVQRLCAGNLAAH